MNEKAMQLIWAVPEKKLSISFEKKIIEIFNSNIKKYV